MDRKQRNTGENKYGRRVSGRLTERDDRSGQPKSAGWGYAQRSPEGAGRSYMQRSSEGMKQSYAPRQPEGARRSYAQGQPEGMKQGCMPRQPERVKRSYVQRSPEEAECGYMQKQSGREVSGSFQGRQNRSVKRDGALQSRMQGAEKDIYPQSHIQGAERGGVLSRQTGNPDEYRTAFRTQDRFSEEKYSGGRKKSGIRDGRSDSGNNNRKNNRGNKNNRRNYKKNARKNGRGNGLRIFLAALIVLLLACGAGTILLYRNQNSRKVKDITVSLDSLDSPNAVLIDAATGTVIGSKNAQERIFPASMVKIMTVLTAIREIRNLSDTVEMSYDYYDMLYARDASRAGFEPGEKAVIRDLLYGALLPSGAECCMELALQAAGSESAFVELMNQNASKLGLTQTQFTNCTGLHDEGQYSTPAEIAAILQDALKNKTFYKVFTTKSYTVEPTDIHPDGFTFQSSMFKGMQSPTVIGGEIMGGKTGYTDDAGHCLASMAKIGGREYILVTAGWAQNPRVDQYHINDAFLAYNALGRALEAE